MSLQFRCFMICGDPWPWSMIFGFFVHTIHIFVGMLVQFHEIHWSDLRHIKHNNNFSTFCTLFMYACHGEIGIWLQIIISCLFWNIHWTTIFCTFKSKSCLELFTGTFKGTEIQTKIPNFHFCVLARQLCKKKLVFEPSM